VGPSGVTRLAFVLVVPGWLALGLLGAAPLTAQEPALEFTGSKKAKPVELSRGARGRQASGTLAVVVRNDTPASGPLELSFESSADRTTIDTDPAEPTVAPRRSARVDVTFHVFAGDDGVPKLAGLLTAAFKVEQGVGSASVEVAPTTAPAPAFVNKSVEFTATDYAGPLPRFLDAIGLRDRDESGAISGHAVVSLRHAGSLNDDPAASGRLSGGGNEIDILLRPPRAAANNLWRARVDVDDVSATGEYKGQLPIDPDVPDSSALDATVKVTDFFVWPLAVVLLGAGLGWLLRDYFYNRYLVRRNLRQALQEAAERYDETLLKAPKGIETLEERLGAPGDARRFRCGAEELEFAQVYCGIGKAHDNEALEASRKAVEELVEDIDRWISVVAALGLLEEAIKELPPRDELSKGAGRTHNIRTDSDELLVGPLDVASDDAMAEFKKRVDSQTTVITYFVLAWRARDKLEDALKKHPGGGNADARRALRECDPRPIYDDAKPEAERTAEETKRLLGRLDHSVRELKRHLSELAPTPPRPRRRARREVAIEQRDGAFTDLVEDLLETERGPDLDAVRLGVSKASAPTKREHRVPTAAELAAGTRVREWLVFLALALLAGLAYLTTTVLDKPFGSARDYLGAFVAGVVGKALVPWERVPGIGSSQKKDAPADAAANGDADDEA
jgi:hypothetical protein